MGACGMVRARCPVPPCPFAHLSELAHMLPHPAGQQVVWV